ncbi:MAG: antibiotic biosynthesis monooxygenase [Steroidobacteraceae bacterium]
MITEIATITIDPAQAAAFEAAVAQAAPLFRGAEGCHGMALERGIEDAARYQLIVRWDTVEHHTVKFRESDGFRAWRQLVGSFFAEPPVVIHTATVARYF